MNMIKKWKLIYEVNMDASREDSIIVEANTSRKAIIFGKKAMEKKYFYVSLKSIEQIK